MLIPRPRSEGLEMGGVAEGYKGALCEDHVWNEEVGVTEC
jgi:hypothetical protein